ncbi:MAG: 1,4-dihydroxy-2-naphthoate octaprenyltransferase [Ignavibacteriaceae bacterium]|nr:MAG: 1,4-dihydroxy-2-naphthoate polyprenyltransferase [Chlorobiota bacterium]GJQ33062.1 MAG: 1,4-dihydroxy-2-naphthoate octaprenyltransferase [Ignavibacteriaceae bacterium]
MNKAVVWIMAARPKTLFAAFAPVIVGASLAVAENNFDAVSSVVALLCSILIQVATNYTNDLYDHLKGADTKERVGPKRALNEGWVTAQQMKMAIYLTFGIAFLMGLYLVYVGGPFILLIGILSIIAGFMYTGGPFPLAYNGLGDLFVFLFFGFVGTIGTYFINTGQVTSQALLASIPVGALVTNILVVNNYRDFDQDRKAGKRTLAVMFGKNFALGEYLILLGSSFAVPLIMFVYYDLNAWVFLPYLTLPFAYKLIVMLLNRHGSELNPALELTAKLSALYGVLFSVGLVL